MGEATSAAAASGGFGGCLVGENETSVSLEALAPNGCDEHGGNCPGGNKEETVDGPIGGVRRRKRMGGGGR